MKVFLFFPTLACLKKISPSPENLRTMTISNKMGDSREIARPENKISKNLCILNILDINV
tara:strand:+ start:337 stop:516 length:180 start_codon:yes stop_codon:yes gene_type:complete